MQLSELQHLMQQLGPSMPEISVILQEEIDCWQLVFDEDVVLQVGWQSEPPRVVFSCSVGEVDDADRDRVFSRLLLANSLPATALGVKFALGHPDEQVLVIAEFEASCLSLDSLGELLREFILQAEQVSAFISEGANSAEHLSTEIASEEPAPSQLA